MPDDALAPPPEPVALEGPSFPPLVKGLASVVMAGLFWSCSRVVGRLLQADIGWASLALLSAGVVLVVVSYAAMVCSRTRIDATHIVQRGLWTRQVALADISHAKLIHFSVLDWLIAPRLMVRVRGRGVMTFHTADRAVLDRMRALGLGRPPMPF